MDNIFIQLAIILGLASSLGYIIQRFKLPLIIAYLFGGLIIASLAIFDVHTSKALSFLPEIGIAFVLFLVGMELDFRELKDLGKPILVAGVLQIVITTILGSSIARLLGFGDIESWYLGLGLSFSSTVIIVKLLLDKKDLSALYGKLALGITLLEDLLAVVLLLGLTVSASIFHLGYQQSYPFLTLGLKAILLFGSVFLVSRFFLTALFRAVSKNTELLFLTALAWCFIYISFAITLGFSVIIGSFLAGMALANSPYHFQIQGKVKPLRDFFVTLFFVYLGTQVNFTEINKVLPSVLIFTTYTLLAKPAIFLLLFGAFGFRKHTMFKSAISISHISEFSLILVLVGLQNGVVSQTALTTIAFSTVLSMIISSVIITRSNKVYKRIKDLIGFFERKNYQNSLESREQVGQLTDHVVVIGGHRVGGQLLRFFKKEQIPHIVLDFNPHQVEALKKIGINAMYGDVGDPDVLDELKLESAKIIISTAQDLDDNLLLLEEIESRKISIPVVVRAETALDAQVLYGSGADLVIIPEVIAGDLLAERLKDNLGRDDFFKDRARIEMDKLERKTLAWE